MARPERRPQTDTREDLTRPTHLEMSENSFHAVFLHQVLDDVLLVAVEPPCDGHEQQPYGAEVGWHAPITAPHAGPRTRWGSLEYSDHTG
jgi:hypothetical protein